MTGKLQPRETSLRDKPQKLIHKQQEHRRSPARNIHIPTEILVQVFVHLSVLDQIWASAVCKLWRTILLHTPSLVASRYTLYVDKPREHKGSGAAYTPFAIHKLFELPSTKGTLHFSIQNSRIQRFSIGLRSKPRSYFVSSYMSNSKKADTAIPPTKHTPIPFRPGILDEPCFATDEILPYLLTPDSLMPRTIRFRMAIPTLENLLLHDDELTFPVFLFEGYQNCHRNIGWKKVQYKTTDPVLYPNSGTSIRQLCGSIMQGVEKWMIETGINISKIHYVELWAETDHEWGNSLKAIVYHPDSLDVAAKVWELERNGPDIEMGQKINEARFELEKAECELMEAQYRLRKAEREELTRAEEEAAGPSRQSGSNE